MTTSYASRICTALLLFGLFAAANSAVAQAPASSDARHEVADLEGRAAERNAERRSRLERQEADALDYLRQTEMEGGPLSIAPKQAWVQFAALNEGFQNGAFPPTGWAAFMASGSDPSSAWQRGSSTLPNYKAFSAYSAISAATAFLVTPQLAPLSGSNTLVFKMWQFSATAYNSQYAVMVSTQSQTNAADFSVVASWSEANPCPGDNLVRTTLPSSRNCLVDLSAYNGQQIYVAFRHINDFGDDFNLDDVLGPPIFIPGTPAFAVSPATPFDIGTAGTCTVRGAATQAFTVSNTSGGVLTVNAPTLSGNAAYSLGSVAPFPVTLLVGESQAFDVVFDPGTVNGSFATTLSIGYDDGTPQTASVALNGTGTNPGNTSGAGIAMRSNVTACSAGSSLPVPGATYIEPIAAGHVRILTNAWTAGSDDEGYKQLDLNSLYPGQFETLRLFGEDRSSIFVTANGSVLLDFGVSMFYGELPVSGSASIQVAAMDMNIDPVVYQGDNQGVSGIPGVFYGLSDVDGDSDQELVITYWHAYKRGSPSISSSSARFLTAQLIVFKADHPSEDDTFEIRLYGGQDANGVKYRNGFDLGIPSITNDIAIGISERSGKEAAIYANGSGVAGALSNNGTHLGLRFEPETQATTASGAGWRMMGVPIRETTYGGTNTPWGFTVGRLADLNLVQSIVGAYPTFPADNVYDGYNGASFSMPGSTSEYLTPGEGFLWYLFDENITPNPLGNGGGTSESYTLPMKLQATGAAHSTDVAVNLNTSGDKFTMVANPFREPLDVSSAQIATWAGATGLSSAVVQAWDPTQGTGSYTTLLGDIAKPWQGFWIEGNTSTSLTIPVSARLASGGTFVGRSASSASRMVAFELAGTTDDASAAVTIDRAATLTFTDNAGPSWDLFDASKLTPMTGFYATLAFEGEREGAPRLKAQESRALDPGAFEVPVIVEAVGTQPTLTLTWPTIENIPETWALTLRDLVTGETVDLRTATSYSFDVAPAPGVSGAQPGDLIARTTSGAQAKAGSTPRFVLSVQPNGIVATDGAGPARFELTAPSPNPARSSSSVSFALPDAGNVTVAIYDVLGRQVALLADGDYAAGWHTVDIATSGLSSGAYLVRMESGSFAQTRRLSVAR